MRTLILPSVKYLNACFTYEPVTGQLRWKHRPRRHFATDKEWKRWNSRFAGTRAGHDRRHCRVHINAKGYTAHRIVWKIVTSKEPPANIDHKNRDGHDNRWLNLREADQTKQNWNKGLARNNASGHKGVSRYHNNKWRAVIHANGKQHYLGLFLTAKAAAAAYEIAARKLHGEFYHAP